jgi:hypothetical protein
MMRERSTQQRAVTVINMHAPTARTQVHKADIVRSEGERDCTQ